MNIFYVFKVIWDNACFSFLRALIGLKKLAPLLHQSEVNMLVTHVFSRFYHTQLFTSSHWLLMIFSFALIG